MKLDPVFPSRLRDYLRRWLPDSLMTAYLERLKNEQLGLADRAVTMAMHRDGFGR